MVGVLALQGSFAPHLRMLLSMGVPCREVRRVADLDGVDRLIIPGGESTTMAKLARDYGLFDAIRERAGELAIFGTCAGAILIGEGPGIPERWGLAPVEIDRNAYGRQRESSARDIFLDPVGDLFHCVFIRAPRIRSTAPGATVLGRDGDDPILVRHGRTLLATFHPELTGDPRIHRYFLEMC